MTRGVQLRLTEDGRMVVLGCGVLAVVVFLTGNNLLAMLLSVGIALVGIGAPLTTFNLRGLEAHRRLPAECFRGVPSHGRWVLTNRRRFMAARGVRIREGHRDAEALFTDVPPKNRGTAAATWRFAERGIVQLDRFVLTSAFPFGLWEAELAVEQPVEVLVYPRPLRGQGESLPAAEGEVEGERAARGGVGDVVGLREYQLGDRPSAIHWRSTARRGTPMVIERSGEVGRAVRITVPDEEDATQWERALSQACGAVIRAFSEGLAVGLRIGDEVYPPEQGGAWRRRLLGALGTAPRRD
ncbi:MAG: DUF58 domain-containing protein [Deltaproteobacteria bacterium]|nr:MAG: DUF58 domain-containing protein [Deltaproteobacteria bacterium]